MSVPLFLYNENVGALDGGTAWQESDAWYGLTVKDFDLGHNQPAPLLGTSAYEFRGTYTGDESNPYMILGGEHYLKLNGCTMNPEGVPIILAGESTLYLLLEGENELRSSLSGSGIFISGGETLYIDAAPGKTGFLTAEGKSGCAGIGGTGNIIIEGGEITAVGGESENGINADRITMYGGKLTADVDGESGTEAHGIKVGDVFRMAGGHLSVHCVNTDRAISGGVLVYGGGTDLKITKTSYGGTEAFIDFVDSNGAAVENPVMLRVKAEDGKGGMVSGLEIAVNGGARYEICGDGYATFMVPGSGSTVNLRFIANGSEVVYEKDVPLIDNVLYGSYPLKEVTVSISAPIPTPASVATPRPSQKSGVTAPPNSARPDPTPSPGPGPSPTPEIPENGSFGTTFTNRGETDISVTVIFAVYSGNGGLLDTRRCTETVPAGETRTFTGGFGRKVTDPVKVFVWEGLDSMIPLNEMTVIPGR